MIGWMNCKMFGISEQLPQLATRTKSPTISVFPVGA